MLVRPTTGLLLTVLVLSAVSAAAQPKSALFDKLATSARQALDAGQLAEAAKLYQQALAIRPNWPEGVFNLGGALFELGRFPEAVKVLKKATALAPDGGFGWALLGLAEARNGQPADAFTHLGKSEDVGLGGNVELETAVRTTAAAILLSASAFDEAFVQLKPLAKLGASGPEVVLAVGMTSLASNQDPAALSDRQKEVATLAGQAVWAGLRQRPEESATLYAQVFDRFADDPGVHYLRGNYMVATDIAAAAAEFQKELAANPSHWPALLMLASIQVRQAQAAAAVQTLERAMTLVPERLKPFCRFELGKANLTAGNVEAALKELALAKKDRPSDSEVRFLLSQAYRKAGRKAEAQQELDAFQKLKAREAPLAVPPQRPE